jgi:hypothetical protein
MFVHAAEDNLYVLGGYSKEKNAASKMEGKIHNDLWMISLKPALQNSKSSPLDFNKISWQKVSRKGDFPSPRCGSAVVLFKTKALVFGGVFDQEGMRSFGKLHCDMSNSLDAQVLDIHWNQYFTMICLHLIWKGVASINWA